MLLAVDAEMAGSIPEPDRLTSCDPLTPLCVSVRAADLAPVAPGVNWMLTVSDEPTATDRDDAEIEKSPLWEPDSDRLLTVRTDVPVLLTVMSIAFAAAPTLTLPKSIVEALIDTAA